jgi:hypothetical protein
LEKQEDEEKKAIKETTHNTRNADKRVHIRFADKRCLSMCCCCCPIPFMIILFFFSGIYVSKRKRRRKQRPLKGASAESVFRTNMGNIIHGQAGLAIIIKGTLLYSCCCCCPGTLLDGSFGQQWGLAGHSSIYSWHFAESSA